MRRIILTAASLIALSGIARAAEPCLSADQLRDIQPALAKAIGVADNGKGCMTPSEIGRYKMAVKADRVSQADRIRAEFKVVDAKPQ